MMKNFKIYKLINEFEPALLKIINNKNILSIDLKDAMLYSLTRGGKRLRPGFCLITAEIFGFNPSYVYNFATCIEMIHEFSLIHDDLPCMDNDDYRRGKLSTHKVFGETIALLAGDSLLNLSSEIAFKDLMDDYNFNKIKAYDVLFRNSGAEGMIDGQSYELESDKTIDNYIKTIIRKTSALFETSIYGTGVYLGLSNDILLLLKELSYNIGIGFQIIDDKYDKNGIYEISEKDADIIYLECKNNIENIYKKITDKNINIFGYKEVTDLLFSDNFKNL